jgi:hypothetical protein
VVKIRGMSGGKPASLDVSTDTLTWRASRDGVADNVATTIHDVKEVAWYEKRWSGIGLAIALAGVLWSLGESMLIGAIMAAIGVALTIRVYTRPTRLLALACGDRRLILEVDADSADPARALAQRIQHVLDTSEAPESPPALP